MGLEINDIHDCHANKDGKCWAKCCPVNKGDWEGIRIYGDDTCPKTHTVKEN